MEKLDFTVQAGKTLLSTSTKYVKTDTADGINQVDITALQSAIDDAVSKDTAQKKAMESVANFTDVQNKYMEAALGLIRKTQSAAKAAYGEDNKPKMKEFHVGGNGIRTVKAMLSELKYMKSVATECKDDLTKSGLKDSDIANFDTISTSLSDSDMQQENSKKVQKRSTKDRDDSMTSLQKTMRRIRHIAKSVFSDQPSVLIEFEPISEGRGGRKAQQAPTSPAPSGVATK